MFSGAGGQIEHGAAVFHGGFDIQKAQLVRASGIIGLGGIDGITGVNQVNEIHTFDHAAIGDIKAGDDAGFQHNPVIKGLPAGHNGRTGRTGLFPATEHEEGNNNNGRDQPDSNDAIIAVTIAIGCFGNGYEREENKR
jgi:hypothetical protein